MSQAIKLCTIRYPPAYNRDLEFSVGLIETVLAA